MCGKQKSHLQPFVIVIAGYVGSGKSTIAACLSKRLENAPVLIFDHYEKYIEWPQDMNQWISNGADPDQIRVPKLKEDLLSLLEGIPVTDPFDGKMIAPGKYILLEEPSGDERGEIKAYIDLVVYIDVPPDVCVTRLVERLIDMGVWNAKGTFEDETKEDLVRQLNAVALWITHYQQARSMYMLGSGMASQKADIVVNGLKTVEEITAEILNGIKIRRTK
jgi:uridine kinase